MKLKKAVQPETTAPAGEYRNFPQVPLMARPIPMPNTKRADDARPVSEPPGILPET